jgi:hypothetical protein
VSAHRKHDREALVPAMCERMANDGIPLEVLAREFGVPTRTINHWREDDKDIDAQFEDARRVGADTIAWQCMTIANTPQEGRVIVEKGDRTEVQVGDMLGHRKLQIDTRLKLLAKWDKRYAERQEINHLGKVTLEQLITGAGEKA